MSDLYLNPSTGDIDLTNSTMRLTQSSGELARQRLVIRLRLYRGEWFANVEKGMPYLRNKYNPIQLLGKTDKDLFDLFVRESVLEDPAIDRIVFYRSVEGIRERSLNVSLRAVLSSEEEVSIENFTI